METKRLILRRVEETDIDLFINLFSDPDMMKYLGTIWSNETIRETLTEWKNEWGSNNYFYGVLERNSTHQQVGIAGLTENTNPYEQGMEFSWFIQKEYQGLGYATEITSAILEFVFDHLGKDRIFAETHPQNAASNRVLEKSGFTCMGEWNHTVDYLPGFATQVLWEYKIGDWKIKK